MAKKFGIAALVVAIVAIIVPFYGLYLSTGAVALSVIAALAGDRIYATATPIIAAVNVLFLSPLTWLLISDHNGRDVPSFYFQVGVFFVAPFVAMFLNSDRKSVV